MSDWGGVYICNIPEAARSNVFEHHSDCYNAPVSPLPHVHSGGIISMFVSAGIPRSGNFSTLHLLFEWTLSVTDFHK